MCREKLASVSCMGRTIWLIQRICKENSFYHPHKHHPARVRIIKNHKNVSVCLSIYSTRRRSGAPVVTNIVFVGVGGCAVMRAYARSLTRRLAQRQYIASLFMQCVWPSIACALCKWCGRAHAHAPSHSLHVDAATEIVGRGRSSVCVFHSFDPVCVFHSFDSVCVFNSFDSV